MMSSWPLLLSALLAYLCGSIPFGLILTKLKGHGDLRAIGSGNIGATNVLRTGDKKLAALTLLCDLLKGLIPVLIARQFGDDVAAAAALGAVLGHIFPPWLGFKGGKGVATAAGVLLAFSWPVGVAAIATWLIVVILFRYSSLAAVVATASTPFFAALFDDRSKIVTVVVIAAIVLVRHQSNIMRLIRGQEDKISFSKKTP
jgi:glycerol-3-phosphate acyltransferase PlsY